MTKTKTERNKLPALITYIIAVLVTVAGLILPLETAALKGGINFDRMPLLQLGGAIAALTGKSTPAFGKPLTGAYSFTFNLNGTAVNVGAYLLLALTAFTVVAVALAVPACIVKKNSPSAKRMIITGEILLATVLLPLSVAGLAMHGSNINLSVLVPLLTVVVMLAVQSIYYYRSSGVMKTVLTVLSAVAIYFLLCATSEPVIKLLDSVAGKMSGSRPFETSAGLFSLDGVPYSGVTSVYVLAKNMQALFSSAPTGMTVTLIIAFALAAVAGINLYLDILGLGKRTKKFMLNANLVRYILQFVLVIALAISVFVIKGSFGLVLYIVAALTIIQLILESVRRARYRKPVAESDEETDEAADHAESDEEYAFGEEGAPAATEAPAPEPVTETQNVVYNVNTIYNGPIDSFIRKLTNEQRVEFAKVFLERNCGNLNCIPDYIVGGDNSRFFSAVFIYYAHVRDLVSDGLMGKLYEEKATL